MLSRQSFVYQRCEILHLAIGCSVAYPLALNMGYYNEHLETLPRADLGHLQLGKLRELMRVLVENPFYSEKFSKAGIDPLSVRQLEDLANVPFTTKGELVASQRLDPPYGKMLSYPRSQYRCLHQTSGTSGSPLLWLDTEDDWATWVRCWGHVFRGAGVTSDDVVLLAFSFGPFVAHWSSLAGARSIGALGIAGGGLSSGQRLQRILDHQVTVMVSTPTYALYLAEVADAEGIDLPGCSVRTTIHAGEPGASVPNVKRRIEELWGAQAYDHAGATEIGAWGFGCTMNNLSVHLNELEFLFEVLDPTGEEPVVNGSRGELVITTLGRLGMPVVRYRTGDLVVRSDDPCGCGRNLSRIEGGVLGRADDMLTVRGVNIYPAAIDNLIRSLPAIVEYEVEIRSQRSLDELLVKVETAPGSEFSQVESALHQAFRSQINIRVAVAQAEPGSLPRYELKAQRFKRVSASI